jgi:hypothetical protein
MSGQSPQAIFPLKSAQRLAVSSVAGFSNSGVSVARVISSV